MFEASRVKRIGVDEFSIIIFFIFLYLLFPSAAIHIILSFSDSSFGTGNLFFDRVYNNLSPEVAFYVLASTALFIFGFIASSGVLLRKNLVLTRPPQREIVLREHVGFIVIFLMFGTVFVFFWGLGMSIEERYAKLVLFRALDESIVRDAFSANAFSATQTVAWLSSAFSIWALRSKKNALFTLFLGVAIISGILMVSRRGLLLPILIIYFCFTFHKNKLHVWKLLPFFALAVFWIAYGKELIGLSAYGTDAQKIFNSYSDRGSMLLRAFSEIGISQVQSFATLHFMPTEFRFGIDHLLSVARRFPDGMLGLNINWPERIVRISTAAFLSPQAADVPPGLVGQAWLDLPVFGSLIWGFIIGIQLKFLSRWGRRYVNNEAKIVVMVLLSFIIALPVNTGSYDFTFSIDIILVVLIIILCFRARKSKVPTGE